jgi:uncharacterized protein
VTPGHRWTALALAGVLLAASPRAAVAAAESDVPFLTGHVNDYAHLLSEPARSRLETSLAELEAKTGAQVAVLTVDTIGDESVEDYSMRVAETWKLGQKGKDNGVLVLVAKDDHKMRIEVGYGFEGTLTDARCERIVAELMRPRFRDGDFAGGLDDATNAIGGFVRGENPLPAVSPTGPTGEPLGWPGRLLALAIFALVVGGVSLVATFSSGCQAWFIYVFLMPFYFAFPAGFATPSAGVAMLAAWVICFPIAKLWLGKTHAGRTWVKSHPVWSSIAAGSAGGSGSHGWSSSDGSSGGFSGGGGSFGGGGASGSW